MLGGGRPFILELANPKKSISITQELLTTAQEKINKNPLVGVHDLRLGNLACFDVLKESEERKVKMYSCLVITTAPLTDEKICELNDIKEIKVN
jgi:tRNA U54 and U55 pseudouridine synthase Pus10